MTYYRQIREYIYTEEWIVDDLGNSVLTPVKNYDDTWYDTTLVESLTDEEVEELGIV